MDGNLQNRGAGITSAPYPLHGRRVVSGVRAAASRRRFWAKHVTPYLFLAPPVAFYLIWVIWPTIQTFYLSLTAWDGVSRRAPFVGLENYVLLARDPVFYRSLENNFKWLLIFVTVPTTAGLALALVFNKNLRFDRFFKASFYSPMVLSFVVIALMFAWFYHPAYGLINSLLRLLGVARRDLPGWLADPAMALYAIIGAAVWRQVGYVMILYLAQLKSIDPTFIEAARVDGARSWQLFRYILLPLLKPATTIVIVISIIDSLRAFDLVYVMTRGGPANASNVLANYMYIMAFNNYRMGYAAAIAVILFLISFGFIGLFLREVLRREEQY